MNDSGMKYTVSISAYLLRNSKRELKPNFGKKTQEMNMLSNSYHFFCYIYNIIKNKKYEDNNASSSNGSKGFPEGIRAPDESEG